MPRTADEIKRDIIALTLRKAVMEEQLHRLWKELEGMEETTDQRIEKFIREKLE